MADAVVVEVVDTVEEGIDIKISPAHEKFLHTVELWQYISVKYEDSAEV